MKRRAICRVGVTANPKGSVLTNELGSNETQMYLVWNFWVGLFFQLILRPTGIISTFHVNSSENVRPQESKEVRLERQ